MKQLVLAALVATLVLASIGCGGSSSDTSSTAGSCSGPAVTLMCPSSAVQGCPEIFGTNMGYSMGGAMKVTFNGKPGTFGANGGPNDVEMCAPAGTKGAVTMEYTSPSGCSATCNITFQ